MMTFNDVSPELQKARHPMLTAFDGNENDAIFVHSSNALDSTDSIDSVILNDSNDLHMKNASGPIDDILLPAHVALCRLVNL